MESRDLRESLALQRRRAEIAVANAMGWTPDMARDVQREVIWWVYARLEAGRNRRHLMRGSAVGWTANGYAELLPIDVPHPGRDNVTVLIEASAVSPGTERARYLRLPNAYVGLGIPGNSAAGTVIEVGAGVDGVNRGDYVAVAGHGARHASVATVPARAVYRAPDDLPRAHAALIRLGIICGQGVRKAALGHGESFCVIGAGPIGLLAQRLAVLGGAQCSAVVARSTAKRDLATGTRFLTTDADAGEIAKLGVPAVIEATGDPEALTIAVRAAGEDGRIVLLGSSRGETKDLPLEEIRRKRLTLIGAHEDTLVAEGERDGGDPERHEGLEFMEALVGGALRVEDLVGKRLDPLECGLFYRELAQRRDLMAAWFDWSELPQTLRLSKSRLLRPPPVAGRGIDFQRRPMADPSRRRFRGRPDPFEGASGNLGIGMLGCGDVATNNAAAIAVAPNTRLVACFDPVERVARSLADQHQATLAHSVEEMLADPAVDAVFIAVPHHIHGSLARSALEAGKHVILEKPLAHRLDDAVETARLARKSGLSLTVCFPYRYDTNVAVAREMIEAGAIGELGGAHLRLLMDKPPPYWVGGFSGRSPSTWRSSREKSGGGVLIMNMSHYVDLIRHVGGVEIDQVRSFAAVTEGEGEVEDSISVAFSFANGALGSMVASSAVRGTLSTEMRLWGSDGHLSIEPEPRVFTMRDIAGVRPGRWQRFGRPSAGEQHMRSIFLSRFASAVAESREPDVTIADALAVQAFIEAAYEASESGMAARADEFLEVAS